MHWCRDDAEDAAFCLPRNLSFAEESYLDSYSVSSSYVSSVARDKRTFYEFERDLLDIVLISQNDEYVDIISCCDIDALKMKQGCESSAVEAKPAPVRMHNVNGEISPPAKTINDVNTFVNEVDDLDSVGSSTEKSIGSDTECVEVINSPDESDLDKVDEGYEASLGEAVYDAFKSMSVSEYSVDESESEPSIIKKCSSPPPPLKIKIEKVADADDAESDSNKLGPSHGSQKSLLDSPLYEDTEFNFNRTELRKSSSLKATKTPPGTPGRKKMVRFADAMGLDLESVRHVMNADAPPKIPASAIADLNVGLERDRKDIGNRYLSATFRQPGASENFLTTVVTQKVSLENAVITNLTITGTVRVANLGFHKSVRIRYTTNAWTSFHDIMASYVQNSCDGPTDRFAFSIVAPSDFVVGSRLEFAISYTINDMVYWDNNNGVNYCFECFAKTTPVETRDSWMHFI